MSSPRATQQGCGKNQTQRPSLPPADGLVESYSTRALAEAEEARLEFGQSGPVGQSQVRRGTSTSGVGVVTFRNAYKATRNHSSSVAHSIKFYSILNPKECKINYNHWVKSRFTFSTRLRTVSNRRTTTTTRTQEGRAQFSQYIQTILAETRRQCPFQIQKTISFFFCYFNRGLNVGTNVFHFLPLILQCKCTPRRNGLVLNQPYNILYYG